MPRVTRRPLAQTDILDIWDFIADDSVAAADRWVDVLDAQFRVLATQPMMGRARDELAPEVRSFPVGRYVVFYVPLVDGIDVVRVLHGARDIDAMFNPESARWGMTPGTALSRALGDLAVHAVPAFRGSFPGAVARDQQQEQHEQQGVQPTRAQASG